MSFRHHLVRWENELDDERLTIIEINQHFGEPLGTMRAMVQQQDLKHPVLWDDACRNTKAYGVTAWPQAWLIDGAGKVFWEGNPARVVNRKAQADALRELLKEKLAEAAESHSGRKDERSKP